MIQKQLQHLFFLFVLLLLGSTSCSTVDIPSATQVTSNETFMDPKTRSYLELSPKEKHEDIIAIRKAAFIIAEYVEMDTIDRKYTLTISKEDASKLGISSKIYAQFCKELKDANKFIREMDSKGEKIKLYDIKGKAKQYKNPQNHSNYLSKRNTTRASSGTPKYMGTIVTLDGGDQGEAIFYNKLGAKSVLCICRNNCALLQVLIVRFDDGGYIKSDWRWSSSLCPYKEMRFSINSLTGSRIKIQFHVGDPCGGSCGWYAY